jgi:hypothetical protein
MTTEFHMLAEALDENIAARAEIKRLRAENAMQAAKLAAIAAMEVPPGDWSGAYRLGFQDAIASARDCAEHVAALLDANPSGCQHCGLDHSEHLQRWVSSVGWHVWTEPTQEQRKARMFALAARPTDTRTQPEED